MVNIQFVRLDEDVCAAMNQMALEKRANVSDLVNQIVRDYLASPQRDNEAKSPPASA